MKAILIEDVRKVKIIEKEEPVRKPGEALLKILYGGICGSDLGSYRGSFAYFDYPRIPGHEFSAEVIDVDENEYGIKKGMIVTGNPYFNCGKCKPCRSGHVNCCEHNETLGCQRDGAFSTYFTMPVERLYDGKGVSPEELACIEPFCISLHGVSRANIQPGDKVLVVGAGTIGVNAAKAAMLKGGDVTICDVAENKLKIAQERIGVPHTILNNDPATFMDKVKAATNGDGFDVTIECVGLPSTFQNCIDAACFAGKMVLIGVGKRNLDFNFTLIQKKELNVYGSRNSLKDDFLWTIDKVKSGELDLHKIVTDIYDFDNAAQAFKDFDEQQGSKLKVLIKF